MGGSGPLKRSSGAAVVLLAIMFLATSASFMYCFESTVVGTSDHMVGKEVNFEDDVTSIMKSLYSDAYAVTESGIYSLDLDGARTIITGDVQDAEIGDCHGDLMVLMDNGTILDHRPGTGVTVSPVQMDGELELVGVYDRVYEFPMDEKFVVLHQSNATGERLAAMKRIDGSMAWSREMPGPVVEVCSDLGSWYISILYENGSVEVLSALNGSLLSSFHVDGTPLDMDLGEAFHRLSVISLNGSYQLTVFDPQPDGAAMLGTMTFDEPVFDLKTMGVYEKQCLRNSSHLMIIEDLAVVRSIPLSHSGHYDVSIFNNMIVVNEGNEAIGYSLWDEGAYWKAEMPSSGGIFIDTEGEFSCTYGAGTIGCLDVKDGWLGDRGYLVLSFSILPIEMITSAIIVFHFFDLGRLNRMKMDRTGIRDKLKVVLAGGAVAFIAFLIMADSTVLRHYAEPLAYAVTGSVAVMLTLPVALIRRPPSRMMMLAKLLLTAFACVLLSILTSLVAGLVIWGAGINYLYGGISYSIDGTLSTIPAMAVLALIVCMPIGLLGGRWIDRLYPKEDVRPEGPDKVFFFVQGTYDQRPGEVVTVFPSTDKNLNMKRNVFRISRVGIPLIIIMMAIAFAQSFATLEWSTIGLCASYLLIAIAILFISKRKLDLYERPVIVRTNGMDAIPDLLDRVKGQNGFIHVSMIECLELVNVRYAEQEENLIIKLRTRDGRSRTIGIRERKVAEEILDLTRRAWNGNWGPAPA